MLLCENAGGERLHGIVVQHRHGGLHDDGAGVQVFVDEVDGAAGDFDAVLQRLVLRVQAGEGGQQRRMDIENARSGYWRMKEALSSRMKPGQADQSTLCLRSSSSSMRS